MAKCAQCERHMQAPRGADPHDALVQRLGVHTLPDAIPLGKADQYVLFHCADCKTSWRRMISGPQTGTWELSWP